MMIGDGTCFVAEEGYRPAKPVPIPLPDGVVIEGYRMVKGDDR